MSRTINNEHDENAHLRSQNEQLWKIIEKQRIMIQNLQKDNIRISAEKDGLQDQIKHLEKETTRKHRVTPLFIPPREKIDAADNTSIPGSATSGSGNKIIPIDIIESTFPLTPTVPTPTTSSSPMPPPRSPYRPFKERSENLSSVSLYPPSPTTTNMLIEEPIIRFESPQQQQNQTIHTDFNGRSSPGSPAPTSNKQRKDSAPSPQIRTQSPFTVPSPSKSSSSLDMLGTNNSFANNNKMKKQQNRESMLPPTRGNLDHDPTMRVASPISYSRSNSSNAIFGRSISDSHTVVLSSSSSSLRTDEISIDLSTPPPPPPQQQQQQLKPASIDLSSGVEKDRLSVKVIKHNIKRNEKGKEVVSFILSVSGLPLNQRWQQGDTWKVEKLYSDFLSLRDKLKKYPQPGDTKLPEKIVFSNSEPNKIEAQTKSLNSYLYTLDFLSDKPELEEFLTTDIYMQQSIDQKEGYLTKRGKNFGGWKTRYYVLNGSVLDYFESKDGTKIGSINLKNAEIGRQVTSTTSTEQTEETNLYQHAFLIVEKVSSTKNRRHILCATSDDDRDAWIQALLQSIHMDNGSSSHGNKPSTSSSASSNTGQKSRKLSKGEIHPISATPISHLKLDQADMEKLASAPTAMTDRSYPYSSMSENNNNPSVTSIDSTSDSSTMAASSLPSNSTTWSTTSPPSTIFGRISMDQPTSSSSAIENTRHPEHSHPISRRNSTNAIESPRLQVQHGDGMSYGRAASPTIPATRENNAYSDPATHDGEQGKKTSKSKAKRMTFWNKKPSSSTDSNISSSSNLAQRQKHRLPEPSLSNPTTTTTHDTKSKGFRGFLSRSSHEQQQPQPHQHISINANQVFGVSLDEAVRVSRISEGYELPAVVFRCIEYLDKYDAFLEEGLYRLSGSNSDMKSLREEFNEKGDVNILEKFSKEGKNKIHEVAGLLKMWLRELPISILTREYRPEFLKVIDLVERKERVNELGRLVSLLPLSYYTLLRALIAHLICVVQNSDVNKMTMRNLSIVFSPTLSIPATIFNLLMTEFEYIFWTTEEGNAAPRMIEDEVTDEQQQAPITVTATATEGEGQNEESVKEIEEVKIIEAENNQPFGLNRRTTLRLREEHGRSNRNSVNYMDGAPNAIVDLEKHLAGAAVLDSNEDDEEVDDFTLTNEQLCVP